MTTAYYMPAAIKSYAYIKTNELEDTKVVLYPCGKSITIGFAFILEGVVKYQLIRGHAHIHGDDLKGWKPSTPIEITFNNVTNSSYFVTLTNNKDYLFTRNKTISPYNYTTGHWYALWVRLWYGELCISPRNSDSCTIEPNMDYRCEPISTKVIKEVKEVQIVEKRSNETAPIFPTPQYGINYPAIIMYFVALVTLSVLFIVTSKIKSGNCKNHNNVSYV